MSVSSHQDITTTPADPAPLGSPGSAPGPDLGPATVLGYPRIGPHRELKVGLEAYWAGASTQDDLLTVARELRAATWRRLAGLGLTALPSNTFSLYDQVLDTAVMVDAVPERYRERPGLDAYFAMARGGPQVAPLPMTKWFDTNYHYLVPEIGPATSFRLADDKPVAEFREALALGYRTRPVLLGPVTFLLLSRPESGAPADFSPLDRLDDVLEVYQELLAALAAEGADWVQLDEPALVADRTPAELAAVARAYVRLGGAAAPRLFVSTYFGDPGEALRVLASTPVQAIGVDLVRGPDPARLLDDLDLRDKTLVAGVVSGRDVWRTDLDAAHGILHLLRPVVGNLVVATSCSLLHVPYDLAAESDLDPELRDRLAFADQKVAEVVALAQRLTGTASPASPPAKRDGRTKDEDIAERSPYPRRAAAQRSHLGLPVLPITTIGSFPQTEALRGARAEARAGRLSPAEYDALIEAEIEHVIRLQERLGLDVLVHGEPERNDMVQYFAEHLDGFATTRHGWVQSYGSRCTRPPILYGQVSRPAPITVRWARYAQSLTDRPVKGMLTGPVTIVAWSFVRRDLPLRQLVEQVAEAIRGEVLDLEAAGVSIIQVDEPALRELLPLRETQQAEYLSWATRAYRWATCATKDETQIHTHVCYSEANQVLAAIDALDADVTTIECTRSDGRVLAEPAMAQFPRGLGPGVYDIHSPRVPSHDEIADRLDAALRVVAADRVWVNPDCGLKTRTYEQVEAALTNVVTATRRLREVLATSDRP
jgi:5-methyltetrahydropteroyltriglutamate--homocysteine methyltransferase